MKPGQAWRGVCGALLLAGSTWVCAAIDVDALWDYDDPAASEQRFRAGLAGGARGDDALILHTQIARTMSLRGRYDEAHAELDQIAAQLSTAGPEAQVRALLERGRTLRSAGDPAGSRTYFEQALGIARPAGLHGLEGDAMHMIALVEPSPEGRLLWNRRLADDALASPDPALRRWAGAALNNLGVQLNELGRHEEALGVFREALPAFEAGGDARRLHVARWMVAHTLRLLGRSDEAQAQFLQLKAERDAAGQPDPEVFAELALLHEARRDAAGAARYREREAAARQAAPAAEGAVPAARTASGVPVSPPAPASSPPGAPADDPPAGAPVPAAPR